VITFRRQILLSVLKISDLGVMVLAFVLATIASLRGTHSVSFAEFFSMRIKIGNLLIVSGLLLLWHVLFSGFGLYRSRRLSSHAAEFWDLLKAVSVATVCVLVAALVFRIRMVTITFVLAFWLLSGIMLVSYRLIARLISRQTRLRGRNLRHMLIVGTNHRAAQFARKMQEEPELGYRVIGFSDSEWSGIAQFRDSGYKLACDLDDLPQFLRTHVVDEVVIALPMRSFHDYASRVASLCEEQGILLRILSNMFNLKIARSRAEVFEDSLITHDAGISEGWPLVSKRMLDFSLALVAIILVSPVFLLAAILIKLTSPGPVLFRQKRIGLNKRQFSIYKFRTMVVDAEQKIQGLEHLNEVSGPVFKIRRDPRIMPIGRFLRKTSIDELPQLFNVLKGDMSLVGPRPLPVRDYQGFDQDWHRRRFSVLPGITCLWQIAGRNSIPFEKWMELDLQYIDTWSLWLDLRIMIKTIPAVIRGSGAA